MAARKPFRYTVLLRVRKLQEDQKAFELAQVQREIRNAVQERDFILQEQRRVLQEASEVLQRPFAGNPVGRYYQYERHLARRAVEKDALIAQKRSEAERRRDALEAAMRQKRVVERLQERHEAAEQADQVQAEQRMTDEVAVNQAALKRGRKTKA